jgi:hypothetical protein
VAASSSSAIDRGPILDTLDIRGFLFLPVRDTNRAIATNPNRIIRPLLDSQSTSLFLAGKISFAFLCIRLG